LRIDLVAMPASILMLTQWFDPEPTSKGLAFAEALVRAGHHTTVVTGLPNYPGGRIYPGYRRRFLTSRRTGQLRIMRAPLVPSHNRSAIGRAANYLSFGLSAAVVGSCIERSDVMYAYHPPITTA